jgi:hypothetical protein
MEFESGSKLSQFGSSVFSGCPSLGAICNPPSPEAIIVSYPTFPKKAVVEKSDVCSEERVRSNSARPRPQKPP